MKLMTLIAITIFSISAFAADCTIKTKARMKGYPLAFSFQKSIVEAIDLKDCKDQAAAKLGTSYQGYVSLPGGLDSSGASGYVTYIVKKVKFSFVEDGVNYTGSIR